MNVGIIPSSICKCTDSTKYGCTLHELGKTFPGWTMIIPKFWNLVTLAVETANLPHCYKSNWAEMVQMHTSTGGK